VEILTIQAFRLGKKQRMSIYPGMAKNTWIVMIVKPILKVPEVFTELQDLTEITKE
jgi:hypothetical protein